MLVLSGVAPEDAVANRTAHPGKEHTTAFGGSHDCRVWIHEIRIPGLIRDERAIDNWKSAEQAATIPIKQAPRNVAGKQAVDDVSDAGQDQSTAAVVVRLIVQELAVDQSDALSLGLGRQCADPLQSTAAAMARVFQERAQDRDHLSTETHGATAHVWEEATVAVVQRLVVLEKAVGQVNPYVASCDRTSK